MRPLLLARPVPWDDAGLVRAPIGWLSGAPNLTVQSRISIACKPSPRGPCIRSLAPDWLIANLVRMPVYKGLVQVLWPPAAFKIDKFLLE